MVSIQTIYRQKRLNLIKDMISSLIDLTQLKKKELEKIPLPKLKQIAKDIEKINTFS